MHTDSPFGVEGNLARVEGKQARAILHWLTWADTDYLAARKLLLAGLLVQGAALANTSIEKYLKSLLALHGKKVAHSHDPLDLYKKVKAQGNSLQLDESFLTLLKKSYQMRYPDDIEDGYNLVLSQALLLDALDQSIKSLLARVEVGNADGAVKRKLNLLIEQQDPQILANNTALGTTTKQELVNEPSLVFECRFLYGDYMGAEYTTKLIDDTGFEKEAFVQESDKTFRLAYIPIDSMETP